jgi:hypothetical protein
MYLKSGLSEVTASRITFATSDGSNGRCAMGVTHTAAISVLPIPVAKAERHPA